MEVYLILCLIGVIIGFTIAFVWAYRYEKKIDQVAAEINDIGKNLKDLKKKKEVINQTILRKREDKEQVGCYKIVIPKKIRKIYKPYQKSRIQLEIEKLLKS